MMLFLVTSINMLLVKSKVKFGTVCEIGNENWYATRVGLGIDGYFSR
jgi:hypothetical protein